MARIVCARRSYFYSLEVIQARKDAFGHLEIVLKAWPVLYPVKDVCGRGALGPVGVQHLSDQVLEILPVVVGNREVIQIEVVSQMEVFVFIPLLCVERLRLSSSLHDGAHVEHH